MKKRLLWLAPVLLFGGPCCRNLVGCTAETPIIPADTLDVIVRIITDVIVGVVIGTLT